MTYTSIKPAKPITPAGHIAHTLQDLLDADLPAEVAAKVRRAHALASRLEPYLQSVTTPPSPPLRQLAERTAMADWDALYADGTTGAALEREMLSGFVEGQFLKMLVAIGGARRVLDVGMFTGYSALSMAEALPPNGTLITCEVDAYAASVAREAFDGSPHGGKIDVRLGPAQQTLAALAGGPAFDLAFVDADKQGYAGYYGQLLGGLVRPGGLVVVDNVLYQGEAYTDPAGRSANGQALADFNRMVAADDRVEQMVLPLRDGVSVIRVKDA